MHNTRGAVRQRRRFRVLLGAAVSFTTDVSESGFCTETMRVLPLRSSVQGCIEGLGKKVAFAGRVVWNVPGDSSLNVRGRMGISFTQVGPELRDLLNSH
jgi:hypothetical protein